MKLIFSDLDGTLLDHDSYSFDAAAEALNSVRKGGVPLVLCSSKTKAEMLLWQERLKIREPFIAENGSGIYFPRGYRDFRIEGAADAGDYLVIEAGIERTTLKEALAFVRERLEVDIRAFSDMTVEEVMGLTSLDRDDAALAMERHFTEPFVIGDPDREHAAEIVAAFEERGLRVVKGGRFYHLMGQVNKGEAVKRVVDIFRNHCGDDIRSIGLGDSENDLSLLCSVDRPVLVRKWDGSWLESEGTEGYTRTEGAGPTGWNEAVSAFLLENEQAEK